MFIWVNNRSDYIFHLITHQKELFFSTIYNKTTLQFQKLVKNPCKLSNMFVYHPHYPILNCPERLLFFHVLLIRAYFHVQIGASVEVYSDEEKNFNGLFFPKISK